MDVELFEHGGEACHFVADEGDVGTGFEGELDVISAAVVIDDGSHVEVVGEDESFVTELVAEEAGEDFFAERGGHLGIELREVEVAGHDGVQLGHEGGVGDEVFFEKVCARDVGDGEVVVGVAEGESVGGEMFSAGEDILLSHPAVEGAGVVDDSLGIAAPAATAEAVVLVGEVVEIEDRGEVKINAEDLEELAGKGTELRDLFWVCFGGEGGGVGRGAAEFTGAPDAAAFLVDGNEGAVEGEGGEGIGEFADLGCGLEVPGKEDVASGLDFPEEGRFFDGEFVAGKADDEAGGIHDLGVLEGGFDKAGEDGVG